MVDGARVLVIDDEEAICELIEAVAESAGFSATSASLPADIERAINDRLKNRSLAAFSTRNRYDFGSTVVVGYAVPLTIGVSLKASMPTEMFGVPGMSAGSQNSCTFGSQFGS